MRDFFIYPCYIGREVIPMRDIGKNIKTARLNQGLTQDQLAEKIHTTRQTVSNYETGKSNPDLDMLIIIAQALGCDIHRLIYGNKVDESKKRRLILTALAAVFALVSGLIFVWCYPIALRNFQTGGWGAQIAYLLMLKWAFFVCIGFVSGGIVSGIIGPRCKSADKPRAIRTYVIIILSAFAVLYAAGIPLLYVGGAELPLLQRAYTALYRSNVIVPGFFAIMGMMISVSDFKYTE